MSEKKYETVDGVVGFERGGKPHAVAFVKSVFVNTDPEVREFQDGRKTVQFLTNIQGSYSKDILEKMAKGQLEATDFGTTAQLSVNVKSDKHKDYLLDLLKKGSRIDSAMVDFTITSANGKTYLNGSIKGLGFVHTKDNPPAAPTPEPIADSSLGF